MEKHCLIFGRGKKLGRRRIKPFLNDYYKGKINEVVARINSFNQIDFSKLDNIDDLIYRLTKDNFVLVGGEHGGHYSEVRKEIGLNLDDFNIVKDSNSIAFFNLPVTLFHEISHSFQYQYGVDVDRKTLRDYLFFERQAEVISLNIISQLEIKLNLELIEQDYIPSYFTKEDVLFLKEWHGL